jgi:hypothetical protein
VNRRDPLLELATVLVAIAAQVFAYEYATNPEFRYAFNKAVGELRYRLRLARWHGARARWRAALKGWQKEALEVHGRPEL